MKNFFAVLLATLVTTYTAASLGDDSDLKPITINVSILKPTGDQVKRSIMRSMMNRSWEVDKVGDNFVEGNIKGKRIRVDMDAENVLKISGTGGTTDKWLKNLEKDIWVELSFCGGL